SPVPLMATFRDISCLPADTVSKAVLRVALDRLMDAGHEGVYYWPSFEIVRWAGSHVKWAAYGTDDGKARHVSRYLVREIVDAFVESFYGQEVSEVLRRSPAGKRRRPPRTQVRMRRMVRRARKRAKATRRL